jgi:hypothetical protein
VKNFANPQDPTTNYGRLLYRADKAGLKNDISAIFWYHGEANANDSWETYPGYFKSIYESWEEDYPGCEKVYLFQVRPGCEDSRMQHRLREIQRQLPALFPKVELMATVGVEDHTGCHFGKDGYFEVGEWIYGLVAHDFYGSTDTTGITPPAIEKVYYRSDAHDEVGLAFDQVVYWPEDTLNSSMKDYFYFDRKSEVVDTFSYSDDSLTLFLKLSEAVDAEELGYLPALYYNKSTQIYEGPWLANARGIGALSFIKKIADSAPVRRPQGDRRRSAQSPVVCKERNGRLVVEIVDPSINRLSLYTLSGECLQSIPAGSAGTVHVVTGEMARGVCILAVETPSSTHRHTVRITE